jgi:hypothetical protein
MKVELATAGSSAKVIQFPVAPAPVPATPAPGQFERFKEMWQQQVVADTALTGSTVKVALALCWHMNRNQHGLAWPGRGRLAKLTGLSRSTVKRAIKALERAGHVTITRSRVGSKNSPNQYQPVLKEVVQNEPTLGSPMTPPLGSRLTPLPQ